MAQKAKSKKKITEWPLYRLLLTLASTVLSVLVLSFSALTIARISNGDFSSAPKFMVWIFVFLGLMYVVLYLKDRTKINLIKSVVLLVFDVVLGIVVLFANNNPFLFSLTAGLFCITLVISRIFDIIEDHSIRSIVMNSLIILFALLLGVGMFISPTNQEEKIQSLITVECIFIALVSFIEAMKVALAQLKIKVLFRIIVSTFSLEVLFGLLVMIVCFSFILVGLEPGVETFTDGLWYCFAVVTTIGFGDIVAVTPMGRILTVMLGVYGLIVVAVITSIIVNFYNETVGKKDAKELKEIQKEEKDKQ